MDNYRNNADYWKNICDMQQKQVKKGLLHYGQRLEDNTSLSPRERIEYTQEELIDALMYLEHLKASMVECAGNWCVNSVKEPESEITPCETCRFFYSGDECETCMHNYVNRYQPIKK